MRDVKLLMNNEEQTIWKAAYAAAFIAEYNVTKKVFGFDRADQINAESAISKADLAVHRLRQWKATENPEAGRYISEYWNDK